MVVFYGRGATRRWDICSHVLFCVLGLEAHSNNVTSREGAELPLSVVGQFLFG
jgi:hypothetical protein